MLEALRQPLEDGVVAVARVGGRAVFPARFRLVGTMNLCPCGGRGDPALDCSCGAARLAAYRERLSRALLDRFDLVVAMPRPRAEQLAAPPGEASAVVRERVAAAVERLTAGPPGRTAAATELLDRAVDRVPLSGRGRARVARVARTVAALADGAASCVTIRRVTWSDSGYPSLLAAIHDPPVALWLRGDAHPALLSRTAVAVVGARACSGYGRAVARALGRELGAAGVVVVSGLARGVDAEAHRGALDAGGATVAVLGCGIDRDYPAAHAELARQICGTGGLIASEYEIGVEPAPWRFPARNRIIAGLCTATVVVEARERSGALITADFALEGGREVLAVPGEITSALSVGANALLRLGATPVTSPADALEAIGVTRVERRARAPDGIAGVVLAELGAGPSTVDEIARRAGLEAGSVAAALVELELSGLVVTEDGLSRPAPRT